MRKEVCKRALNNAALSTISPGYVNPAAMIGGMSAKANSPAQTPRIRNRFQRYERIIAYAILGAVVAFMLATVAHSLNASGYLSAWDAGGHLLKADYFAHHILPTGHLTGWFPSWHGGFDLFQFYPPLLYYILGPLTLVMDPELALRLVTAGLWLSLVPVTYYFLRSFEVIREQSPVIAAIGTSFLLALNASFGIGLGALYGVGLLPNGLGFVLAIWLLGRLKRDVSDPSRGVAQLLASGGLFGLLVLAHTFSAYWWGLASVALVASVLPYAKGATARRRRNAVLLRYGTVLLTGVLLSAYWWIPLALNLGSMGATGVIQQAPKSEIFASLVFAKDSGGLVMAVLAAGGLFTLAARTSLRTFWLFVGLSVLSLLLSLNVINRFLPFGSVVGSSQFIRFQAFFAWLMMVLAVFGLVGIWQLLKRAGSSGTAAASPQSAAVSKRPPKTAAKPAPTSSAGYAPHLVLAAATALLFVAVLYPTLQTKKGFVNVVDESKGDELQAAADYLRANLRTGEFVLSEFNWETRLRFGSPHFINQRLPMLVSNLWDLDGNFPEGTDGAAQPVLAASTLHDPAFLNSQRAYLASRGMRYLITTAPTNRPNVASLPWLRPVYAGEELAIYEVAGYQNRFGLPAAAASKLSDVRFDDLGVYTLEFGEPASLERGTTLALSHHPWLTVTADGKPVPTVKDSQRRMVLGAAAENVSRLEVRYDPPAAATAAGAVSLVALVGIIVGMLARQKIRFLRLPVRRPRRAGLTRPASRRDRRPLRTRPPRP